MKKLLLFVVLFYTSLTVMSQDVIVKHDGSTILSKVMEIGSAEIKYKKWSNVEGPVYAISRSEVLSINYQNGEVEIFSTMIDEELDDVVNSFQGIMEYRNKGMGSLLVVGEHELTDEEVRACFGEQGYNDYLRAQSNLQTSNVFGTLGLVFLAPAVGGILCGLVLNSSSAYLIGFVSSAISIPSIIVEIVLHSVGKRGMVSMANSYNSRNKNRQSANLQVFPSIINNQFGGAAGVTLSLNF